MEIDPTKENAPLAGEAKEALLVSIRQSIRATREVIKDSVCYACTKGAAMDRAYLIERIITLSARLSHLGISESLSGWPISDLFGLYAFLQRLSDE